MTTTFNGLREYRKEIVHKCGCKKWIITLGYKPDYSELRKKICPRCVLDKLLMDLTEEKEDQNVAHCG